MPQPLLLSQEIQQSTVTAQSLFIQHLVQALAHLNFTAIEQLMQEVDEEQGFGYSNKWAFISIDHDQEEDDNKEPAYADIHSNDKYEFLASMQRLIQHWLAQQPALPLVVEKAACYGCQKGKECPNNQIYSFIDTSTLEGNNPVLFSFNLETSPTGELTEVLQCRYAMPPSLKDHPALQYLYTADWEKDMLPF